MLRAHVSNSPKKVTEIASPALWANSYPPPLPSSILMAGSPRPRSSAEIISQTLVLADSRLITGVRLRTLL